MHELHPAAVFLARSSKPEARRDTNPVAMRKSGVKKIRLALSLDLVLYRQTNSARPRFSVCISRLRCAESGRQPKSDEIKRSDFKPLAVANGLRALAFSERSGLRLTYWQGGAAQYMYPIASRLYRFLLSSRNILESQSLARVLLKSTTRNPYTPYGHRIACPHAMQEIQYSAAITRGPYSSF